jgi:hypothetical protein
MSYQLPSSKIVKGFKTRPSLLKIRASGGPSKSVGGNSKKVGGHSKSEGGNSNALFLHHTAQIIVPKKTTVGE